MTQQNRNFYIVLALNLITFFGISLFFTMRFKNSTPEGSEELFWAQNSLLAELQYVKHTAVLKELPLNPTRRFLASRLTPFNLSQMQESLIEKDLFIPLEVIKSNFEYFIQKSYRNTTYITSKLRSSKERPSPEKHTDLLVTLELKSELSYQNNHPHSNIFYTVTEFSPTTSPVVISSNLSKETMKEFNEQAQHIQRMLPHNSNDTPKIFRISLSGEKYLTIAKVLTSTKNIQQILFTSMARPFYKTIDEFSVSLFILSFLCASFCVLVFGLIDYKGN